MTSTPKISPIIYSRSSIRKELGISSVTQWRWERDSVIPTPDIEINNRCYYSAERRQEVIAAVLGNKKEAA